MSGKAHTLLKQSHVLGSWVALRPEKALVKATKYVVGFDNMDEQELLQQQSQAFELAAADRSLHQALSWQQAPKLKEVTFGESPWGAYGNIGFELKTSVPAAAYLVLVRVANAANMQEAKEVLLVPKAEGGKDVIWLQHGPCQFGSNVVFFKPQQKLWLTFDLVNHEGKVIRWPHAPQSVDIKPSVN